ncbi:hypothetical protein [Calothrix rhizosoleniae]|uniref:hypothetical protein n=1 Tax=Calothrix rhizosoleniae TaxID=888997 RepID=UPI001F277372|nr:hypothetical protein [Calothrix rhizosoleniae]
MLLDVLDKLIFLEALEDAMDSEILRRAFQENQRFTTLESIVASRGDDCRHSPHST